MTPVGELCWSCKTPIEENDRGFLLGSEEDETVRATPCHRECMYREAVGEPGWPQTPERRRREALELWIRDKGRD